jgi:hypothetical protein
MVHGERFTEKKIRDRSSGRWKVDFEPFRAL